MAVDFATFLAADSTGQRPVRLNRQPRETHKEIAMLDMLNRFFKEDEGAQVVEYALIIAVVSIALVLALQPLTLGASFGAFIARVATCLTTAVCV